MSRRETCSNAKCGHDKTNHLAETISVGDVNEQRRVTVRMKCQAHFCGCPVYQAPRKDDE